MKLYAQHGFGKGSKIDRAIDEDILDGVIFGPINEKPDSLRVCLERLSEHESQPDLIVDPQLYVSMLSDPKEGNLPLYDRYYETGLKLRDFTPRRTQELVRGCIDFQRELPVSHIVSPTILLDSFTNRPAQIAHFMAQAALEYVDSIRESRPLLLAFTFDETSLSQSEAVTEFLDTVSLYKSRGFYLVVSRTGGYSQFFPPERMANWLMMLYSLGARNHFEVVCGYADFVALPAAALGVSAAASGWFQSLRKFDVKRFMPSGGGRQPRERYSSLPLLNSIYLQELYNCWELGLMEPILTRTQFDKMFDKDTPPLDENWGVETSTLHHWATLKKVFDIPNAKRTSERVVQVEEAITRASRLYRNLQQEGVQFDPITGPGHLRDWAAAIELFRAAARI